MPASPCREPKLLQNQDVSIGHYENFPVASLLLPPGLRDPVAVIYRYARSADDLADEGSDPADVRLQKLNVYRSAMARIAAGGTPTVPLFRDVARIVRTHALPLEPFTDLLDAFSQDVVKHRYATFAELLEYCRRSANPVGRLLLHLFRRAGAQELAWSDSICSGLQLVNFWQDIDIDHAKGRIYVPNDDLRTHGVTERHFAEKRCDAAWQALLRFEAARARAMLLAGMPLAASLPGRIGLELRATVHGGLRILEKLERARFDVFRQRPVLKWYDWPLVLLRAA
jgi:squalene synthase HpnC